MMSEQPKLSQRKGRIDRSFQVEVGRGFGEIAHSFEKCVGDIVDHAFWPSVSFRVVCKLFSVLAVGFRQCTSAEHTT